MRKIVLALAAVAAFGLAVPVISAPAEAHTVKKVVVIKKKGHMHRGHHHGYDRGRHYGWRNHGHHQHRSGATVIVR